MFSNAPRIPPRKPTVHRATENCFLTSFSAYFSVLFSAKKNTTFSWKISVFSLNWREKSTLQTQLASTQRFSKPALKIKQVLVRYHHIIFYPINFLLPQNIKKNLQIWYEPVFFWLWKFTQFFTLFFETLMAEIFEKKTCFKRKHPDGKFGKFRDVKIERFDYKMMLNYMKKVPRWKCSKNEHSRWILAIFYRRNKLNQRWKYRKCKHLSVDMIKTKICMKFANFQFHIREFSPPQAAKMGFTSLFQKALF